MRGQRLRHLTHMTMRECYLFVGAGARHGDPLRIPLWRRGLQGGAEATPTICLACPAGFFIMASRTTAAMRAQPNPRARSYSAGQQSSPGAQPRRDAAAANSVRELTFSLAKTCERWVFTVPAPMNRRLPISGFVKPCAASSTTCSSVGVRLSHPVVGRLRLPLARRA